MTRTLTAEMVEQYTKDHPMTSEEQYLDLVRWVRSSDALRPDRTDTGTQSRFGGQMRFDLEEGFPLLTTKKTFLGGIIHELLWFLEGNTNNNDLLARGTKIWNDWAVKDREERELSTEERKELLMQHLSEKGYVGIACGYEQETNVDWLAQKKAEGYLVLESGSIADYMDQVAKIPRTVVVSRGPDDGKLGPIYGEQWRRWKTHRWVTETRDRTPAELVAELLELQQHELAVDIIRLEKLCTEQPTEENLTLLSAAAQKAHGLGVSSTVTEQRLKEETIDQIAELIENLKKKPFSRRHVITAWNPADLPNESISPEANVLNGRQALASCHCLFQFYVSRRDLVDVVAEGGAEAKVEFDSYVQTLPKPSQPDQWAAAIWLNEQMYKFYEDRGVRTRRLSCHLYQRSADLMVGVPFNIASYALLTMMIAQCVDMVPGEFVHSFGDVHIYVNHFKGADEQCQRKPLPWPQMKINPAVKDIDGFKREDFELVDYHHHAPIVYAIAK